MAGSGPLFQNGQERQMTTIRSLLAGTVLILGMLLAVNLS